MSDWDIDTFNECFFENEHGYNKLIARHFLAIHLIQPPVEVFRCGLKSVRTYFKELTMSKTVKHSRKRYLLHEITLDFVEFCKHFHHFQ